MSDRPFGADRGQSDIIGYVIIFSAILITIGVVVAFGLTALDEVQSSTRTDNAEFAMQSVGSDLNALYRGTATSRNTRLTLGSGSLATGPPTSVNVTGKVNGRKLVLNRTFRPVVFSTSEADIVYENTLLVRDEREGAVAIDEPLFRASSDRAVIPVVETNATGVESVSGGTRQVHAVLANTNATSLSSDPSTSIEVNVTIQTVPDRADVWGRQLNQTFEGMTRPGGTEPVCQPLRDSALSCVFETDRMVVSHAGIRYEFR